VNVAPQKTPIRFGIQTGQQEVSWEELRDVWLEIEALGYDEIWAYDHFIPTGTRLLDSPCFEGWTLLAALAQNVKRVNKRATRFLATMDDVRRFAREVMPAFR
jgi:alkanesulfonate monooxygenase SsuD/methylene tetrahydromethanopterin reductase-like flavin-dependent oxidoreductase (luciferase family)